MQILDTFLNILLFIVCLSSLIMIHEAGHLSAAKIFKVYCEDFSIGFGKAFFHKKRKNGETYFSLRIIPFGGFVAMADQGGETQSGVIVPPERSINGTKKWKAAIIMSAGVIMNFLLAIVLLFCNFMFFPSQTFYSNGLDVVAGSKAEQAGILATNIDRETGKWISGDLLHYTVDERFTKLGERRFNYDTRATANFTDGTSVPVVAVVDEKEVMLFDDFNYSKKLHFYEKKDGKDIANYAEEVKYDEITSTGAKLESITLYPYFYRPKEGSYYCTHCHTSGLMKDLLVKEENGNKTYHCPTCDKEMKLTGNLNAHVESSDPYITPIIMNVDAANKGFENPGLKFFYEEYQDNFQEAWADTFEGFGQGASQIFVAIGNLFVGQGWENTGSIISIYTQSAQMLQTRNFGYYLWYWGLISINLGIFNLLPFPGLDGWQILVLAIEGITRKKIPEKAKSIMSYVGLGLLMVLMVVLLAKDIFMLF